MRKRHPGFYVSVRIAGATHSGLPGELLDGPWASRAAAERRAAEIASEREREALVSVVEIGEDGTTVVREGEG